MSAAATSVECSAVTAVGVAVASVEALADAAVTRAVTPPAPAASFAPSPMAVYAAALRRAEAGVQVRVAAVDQAGRSRTVLPAAWCRDSLDGDAGLLRRCGGRVLDVGCGPGRLVAALASRGHAALGIDVSAEAVRLARRRGAPVLRCDVFGPVPEAGRWSRVILADGNIGIGGDPVRLLRRCRRLTADAGLILVELDPPGFGAWSGSLRLVIEGAAAGAGPSSPFPWAYAGVDQLAGLASRSGLAVVECWSEVGRWFACLA